MDVVPRNELRGELYQEEAPRGGGISGVGWMAEQQQALSYTATLLLLLLATRK